jgi:hypothetical protein
MGNLGRSSITNIGKREWEKMEINDYKFYRKNLITVKESIQWYFKAYLKASD